MFKTIAGAILALTFSLTATAQTSETLPDGAGKSIVQRMCVGCHSLQVVVAKRATHDQWETIVQQMVSRGADGTDDEIVIVIDYLAKNFPPAAKPADPPPAVAHLKPVRNWLIATQSDIEKGFVR